MQIYQKQEISFILGFNWENKGDLQILYRLVRFPYSLEVQENMFVYKTMVSVYHG